MYVNMYVYALILHHKYRKIVIQYLNYDVITFDPTAIYIHLFIALFFIVFHTYCQVPICNIIDYFNNIAKLYLRVFVPTLSLKIEIFLKYLNLKSSYKIYSLIK